MSLLSKLTFVPLQPGVHDLVLVSYREDSLTSEKKETPETFPVVILTVAPASEPRQLIDITLFEKDVDRTLDNIQLIIKQPGLAGSAALDYAITNKVVFKSSYELNVTPTKTHHNWHIGWVRPDKPAVAIDLATTAVAPRR